MRVTTSNYSDNLVTHLQRITRRQVSLQDQISSGQRVQSPEDDPLAAGQVLKVRAQSASAQQYQKNIENHNEFASVTHSVMRSLKTVLDRAQEIAFSADGLDSPGDLRTYAVEVGQLIEHAVQVANTAHRGEFILAGTKNDARPFTATVDAEGLVTNVTFTGNSDLSESEIARGVPISSRVVGENNDGAGERGLLTDSRYGADLFAHLIALQQSLASGDIEGIAATVRPMLASDEENILHHLGGNASLQSRLEATLNSVKDEKISLEGEMSRRSDADLAETIVRLNQSQTNYQAALQSAGSVMNLTLLDFLR
jgi:flagellar hook-associated protein 3 FlgL